MPKADFYLIDKPRFRAEPWRLVCELAKMAFEAGLPTLVLARTQEQAEALDEQLWEFDPDAYVPHQLAGEEDDGEAPVLIVAPGVATPDRAMVINLRDACAVGTFDSVKEVVPADESERTGSRARWTEYKQRGFAVRKFDM